MPQMAWSDKRERQYEHIKESYRDEGVSTGKAEERAARTVNKTWAVPSGVGRIVRDGDRRVFQPL